jgi:hypothetical protein
VTVGRSLFTFAHDVVDAGARTIVDDIVDRAGADGVTMAVAYHGARDVFPHGRTARRRYLEPGAVYFRPDPDVYRGSPIKPVVSELVTTRSPLAELVEAAAVRSVQVHGWTVFLHHDRISEVLAGSPRDAFGDVVRTNLCPSHPASRAYARALAEDLTRHGVSTILAESPHFAPLEHGGQHERYLLPLGPRTRFLLGLCFCDACIQRAAGEGIDAGRLRTWVRDRIEEAFDRDVDDPPGDLSRSAIGALAGGDMEGYLRMRERAVTSLATELQGVARSAGVRLAFIDPSGASASIGADPPNEAGAASRSWQWGIDLERLATAVDQIEILAYAPDDGRAIDDVGGYRAVLGKAADIAVALRPTVPDSMTVERLTARIRASLEAGVSRLDFYHYGLMRLDALDRIRIAFEAASEEDR